MRKFRNIEAIEDMISNRQTIDPLEFIMMFLSTIT